MRGEVRTCKINCRFVCASGDGGDSRESGRSAGHGRDAMDGQQQRGQTLSVHIARLHDQPQRQRRQRSETHVSRSVVTFVRSFIHSFIRSFSVRFLPFSPMSRQQWRCADERCPLFSRPQSFAVLPAYGNPILLPFLRPFLLSVCLLSLSIHSYSYYFVLSLTVPGYSYSFFFISMSLFRYFVYSIIPRESMKRFHSIFAWEVSK